MRINDLLKINFRKTRIPLKKGERSGLGVNKETVKLFKEIFPIMSENTAILFLLQYYIKREKNNLELDEEIIEIIAKEEVLNEPKI